MTGNKQHKEIEAKAHLSDNVRVALIKLFNEQYGQGTEEIKDDTYFYTDGGDSRIRRENDTYIFTKKHYSMNGTTEINDEEEKFISKQQALQYESTHETFLKKNKQGFIWSTKVLNRENTYPMNIEIVKVEGQYKKNAFKNLGWFLEVEVLIENVTDENVKNGVSIITEFFDKLKLTDSIEKQKYMAMLGAV